MNETVKDPLPPEHRRFVLGQATLRLAIFALLVVVLIVWLVVG